MQSLRKVICLDFIYQMRRRNGGRSHNLQFLKGCQTKSRRIPRPTAHESKPFVEQFDEAMSSASRLQAICQYHRNMVGEVTAATASTKIESEFHGRHQHAPR
jgi:hypothetical protein